MIMTHYVIFGRSSTGITIAHTQTNKQSKEQLEQAKQSKNKHVGEQARDLIFH